MAFAALMSSPAGRIARIVAGLVLIALGIALGGGWLVLVVVGLLPLAAGASNLCVLGPLMGAPLNGRECRR